MNKSNFGNTVLPKTDHIYFYAIIKKAIVPVVFFYPSCLSHDATQF